MNTHYVKDPNVNTFALEDSADFSLSERLQKAGKDAEQIKLVTANSKIREVRNATLLLLGGNNNFSYDDAVRIANAVESISLLTEILRRAERDLRVSDELIEELKYLLGIRSSVPMHQMA